MSDDDLRGMRDDDLLPGDSEYSLPLESHPVDHETPETGPANDADAPTITASGKVRYSRRQMGRARDLLARFSAARRAERFYPLEHPVAHGAVAALMSSLSEYHDEGVDVTLTFYEGEILLGEQLLTEESILFDQLVRDMTSIGAGSITIGRGTTSQEVETLLSVLGTNADALEVGGGIEAAVQARGLRHISVTTVRAVERAAAQAGDPAEAAKSSFGGAVSLLREVERLMRANRQISPAKVKGVVRSLVDNVLTNQYAMLQLTGLKNYDEYTYYHSANVAILSLALGSTITRDYRFLSSLGVGALLHDVGKLTVDHDILNKTGALTPAEWAVVRRHPVTGAQLVSQLPGVDRSAVVTILEHHIRYDCTGYPSRTPQRQQHLASRIVAVADSYDAMTSRRSYSAARVQDEAMALLAKCAGASLDPALVRLFIRLLGVYPPRSVVRLASGEIAIVLRPNQGEPLRPVIRLISSPSGEMLEPVDIDLSTDSGRSIKGCIDPRLVNIEVDDFV